MNLYIAFCYMDIPIFVSSLLMELGPFCYRFVGFFFPLFVFHSSLCLLPSLPSHDYNVLKSILFHIPLCIYLYTAKGLIPKIELLVKGDVYLKFGRYWMSGILQELQKACIDFVSLTYFHVFLSLSSQFSLKC